MGVNSFLDKDYQAAFKETTCIMDCIYVMRNELIEGDYEKAILATENALRSFKSLRQMQQEKEHQNELELMIQQAQEKGMGIVVIKGLLGNG